MDSAPRDDTPILLWSGWGISVGKRSRYFNEERWYGIVDGAFAWEGSEETGGIREINSPTHWMPLPEPPLQQ